MQVSPINNKPNFKGTVVKNEILDNVIQQSNNCRERIFPLLDFMLNKTPKTDVFELRYNETSPSEDEVQLLYNGKVARHIQLHEDENTPKDKTIGNIGFQIFSEVTNYLDVLKRTEYNDIAPEVQEDIKFLNEKIKSKKEQIMDDTVMYHEYSRIPEYEDSANYYNNLITENEEYIGILKNKCDELNEQLEQKLEPYYKRIAAQLGYKLEERQPKKQEIVKQEPSEIQENQTPQINNIDLEKQKEIEKIDNEIRRLKDDLEYLEEYFDDLDYEDSSKTKLELQERIDKTNAELKELREKRIKLKY